MFNERDEYWMREALGLAKKAASLEEVPIGAVLILNDEKIGEGFNQPITANDPTAHAEIIALRNAAEKIGNYRLVNSTLYVTLEPCVMCAGALVHARIQRLVYGAKSPKNGAVHSATNILDQTYLNHKINYQNGLLETDCSHMLSAFFREPL